MKAEVDVKAAPDKLPEGWVLVDGNDCPISVSWVASNGDCNPIYTRNMDIMASANSNTPLHCEVEDSDYEMDHSPDGGGMNVSWAALLDFRYLLLTTDKGSHPNP